MSYQQFLEMIGMDEGIAQIAMNDFVVINTRIHRDNLFLSGSSIDGLGVFVSKDLPKDTHWIASKGHVKYLCGRYINHSDSPNCKLVRTADTVVCVLLEDIESRTELTVSYIENLKT